MLTQKMTFFAEEHSKWKSPPIMQLQSGDTISCSDT